ETIFTNHISDKRVVYGMYKELLKVYNKEITQFRKWAKDLNSHLTKEHKQMANKHVKRCSILLVIKERQIKTMIEYGYKPTKYEPPRCPKAAGTLTHCWWECKMVQTLPETVWQFCKYIYVYIYTQNIYHISYDPAITISPTGKFSPRQIKIILTQMFIATLFIISKDWKQTKCPS
ncbi:LORF2 protein, partial [Crocuta crocuta]